jgi:hypothetical protein
MSTYDQRSDQDPAERRQADETRVHETGRDALARWGLASPDTGQVPVYESRDTYRDEPEAYRESEDDAEARRYEHFGGINWGAGFFGWLVTLAFAILLTGIVGGGLAALDRTITMPAGIGTEPRATTLVAAVAALVVLMTAYYTGGYVAGRMSRYDGGKQGVAVWVTGLMLSALAVGLGLMFGSQYNLLDQVSVPSLPLPSGSLGLGAVVAAVAALLGSLIAAIGGGKVGCRYHLKVDDYQ